MPTWPKTKDSYSRYCYEILLLPVTRLSLVPSELVKLIKLRLPLNGHKRVLANELSLARFQTAEHTFSNKTVPYIVQKCGQILMI